MTIQQTDLYYDHAERQCRRVINTKNGIEGRNITLEEAKTMWRQGNYSDHNLAFQTLANHGFDMEAVEDYYREQDKYS